MCCVHGRQQGGTGAEGQGSVVVCCNGFHWGGGGDCSGQRPVGPFYRLSAYSISGGRRPAGLRGCFAQSQARAMPGRTAAPPSAASPFPLSPSPHPHPPPTPTTHITAPPDRAVPWMGVRLCRGSLQVDLLPEEGRAKAVKKVQRRLAQTFDLTKFAGVAMVPVSAKPAGACTHWGCVGGGRAV